MWYVEGSWENKEINFGQLRGNTLVENQNLSYWYYLSAAKRWLRNNLFFMLILNKESFLTHNLKLQCYASCNTPGAGVHQIESSQKPSLLTQHMELFNRSLKDPVKSYVHPVEAFLLLTMTYSWLMLSRHRVDFAPKAACHPVTRHSTRPKTIDNQTGTKCKNPQRLRTKHPTAHIKCKHPENVWSLGSLVTNLI